VAQQHQEAQSGMALVVRAGQGEQQVHAKVAAQSV
jgi:hypothetical protein